MGEGGLDNLFMSMIKPHVHNIQGKAIELMKSEREDHIEIYTNIEE
jgi:hypothetical protein